MRRDIDSVSTIESGAGRLRFVHVDAPGDIASSASLSMTDAIRPIETGRPVGAYFFDRAHADSPPSPALPPERGEGEINLQLCESATGRTGVSRQTPDAHWELRSGERLVGRCSLWWSRTPKLDERRVGFIGHVAAESRYLPPLLRHACAQLSVQGCALAVGPVDGSTWHNYRLVTESSVHPPFFLEPVNPPQWPDLFVQAGFQPVAHYFSALCSQLEVENPRVTRAKLRLIDAGVQVRPIDPQTLEADLLKIFSVASAAFRSNLLYSEPTREDFIADCRSLAAAVPHDLVLLAEDAGSPVGFVFAAPDMLQGQRGERMDTIVVKTLAVLAGRRFAGLGQWLLSEVQQRAHALGFRRAIHALVRDAGYLQRISGRSAVPIRRYTLLAKDLQP